ncbi:hypothetical protein ruthe_02251 [Rubellimicrobium thermophilum DSM 16684]|uniref:Uncharacterized protein n=1 Tax=Rubellimicrobium thermophilum DSM 16684 TaxID=1123069 RepID=S9QXV6_9RHOB|nr:hypothetical protein ruthe_02251 [Rubellimicrobium thermophilum DSM 16684]
MRREPAGGRRGRRTGAPDGGAGTETADANRGREPRKGMATPLSDMGQGACERGVPLQDTPPV